MDRNIIATYSHDDRQVRFLMRYSLLTGLFAGIVIGGFIHAVLN